MSLDRSPPKGVGEGGRGAAVGHNGTLCKIALHQGLETTWQHHELVVGESDASKRVQGGQQCLDRQHGAPHQ